MLVSRLCELVIPFALSPRADTHAHMLGIGASQRIKHPRALCVLSA